MNEPTDDEMNQFYDSQAAKGRVIHREGEIDKSKFSNFHPDMHALTIARLSLYSTRDLIARLLLGIATKDDIDWLLRNV